MKTHNPYSPPTSKSTVPKRCRPLQRDWWSYRLRTAAGIGIALAVAGFNGSPKGRLIGAIFGFPIGIVITTGVSAIVGYTAEKHLTSDRIAFLGAICGALTTTVCLAGLAAYSSSMNFHWDIMFLLSVAVAFLYVAIPGAVGGWVGSMSCSEPAERARVRKTVARLRKRRYSKTSEL